MRHVSHLLQLGETCVSLFSIPGSNTEAEWQNQCDVGIHMQHLSTLYGKYNSYFKCVFVSSVRSVFAVGGEGFITRGTLVFLHTRMCHLVT